MCGMLSPRPLRQRAKPCRAVQDEANGLKGMDERTVTFFTNTPKAAAPCLPF